MKFLSSQFAYFFASRRTKTNIRKLLKFLLVLVGLFVLYGILFHYIMEFEGRSGEHTWLTGFYWTLVTMTTLGFGDVVFHTDLGRIFSMVVIISGVMLLLVMLPFTFIEFFYAPWMNAVNQARAPRELPPETRDHVIITKLDAITTSLIRKLKDYNIRYTLLEPDLQRALELADQDYDVVNLPPDDLETYRMIRVEQAAMVVASGGDTINTNVTFTVREFNPDVPIVAMAASEDSIDILKMAGATQVLQMGEMLGRSLARRTLGGNARVHVIGHIDNLVIGEATAQETPLVGKTIRESGLREKIGISVVGVWERGEFRQPRPDCMITPKTVLVLAGTVEQLRRYDEVLSIYHVSDQPVVILGAGRVGRAAAHALEERQIDYRIVDKNPERILEPDRYILGDAADRNVLERAGIEKAHTTLVTTHDDDVNIYLTIYCRQLSPSMQIVSRATYERNVSTLHRAGADFVMSYATMGANSIFNLLEKQDIVMIAEGLNIFTRKAVGVLVGQSLIESDIRQKTGCTVIAIKDGSEMLVNPDPTRRLQTGDEMVLIGPSEGESLFNQLYELA
ncbi:MAG: potassium channel family protein [Bacteroidota bacterium]